MNTSSAPNLVGASTEVWYPYFMAIYILITLATTAGNVLTMVAYWTTPHLQTPSNLLIFNLSLVDSLVPYLSMPSVIFNHTEAGLKYILKSKWDCLFWRWQSIASTFASMVAISALGLERLVAIIFPYRYYTLITDKSVKIINIVIWVASFTITIPPLFNWSTWAPSLRCLTMYVYHPPFNSFLAFLRTVILVVTAAMNICIAGVAAQKSKSGPAGQVADGAQGPQPEKFNFKLTKMLLTVVGIFYACWAPYIATTAIYSARNGIVPNWFKMAHDFAKLLIGVNSALNPLIYAKGNAKFRAAFKKILARLFRVQINESRE